MRSFCFDLVISQVDHAVYSWAVAANNDVLDDGVETNITDCLVAASEHMPVDSLACVSYRGITLGTYRRRWLEEGPAEIADKLMGMYAALVD